MKSLAMGLALTVVAAFGARSHHGNSEYDLRIVVRFEDTVLEHRWINPRGFTKLAMRNAAGEPITLEIETAPPAVLRTGGVTADSLVEGDRVVAVLEDPEYLAQPVMGAGELSYRHDLTVGGMKCDREAASRFFRNSSDSAHATGRAQGRFR